MKPLLILLIASATLLSCSKRNDNRTEIGNEGLVGFEVESTNHNKLYNTAVEDIQNGKLDRADSIYKRLLVLEPENKELIYIGLGTVNFKKNNLPEALNYYSKAIDANDNSYEAYLGLGLIYSHQINEEKALESYRTAMEIAPERPDAYWGLSAVFEQFKKIDSANYYAEKFAQMVPDSKYISSPAE